MSVIGFIAGMFDPLHAGHVEILKIAKSKCDYLIAAVGTDDYIREHKKHEPLLPYEDRSYVVEAIKYVDRVVAVSNHDKMAMYNIYHFDVLFVGWDHKSDEEDMEAIVQLEKLGVKTVFVERHRNISSSIIKERAFRLELERKRQEASQQRSLVDHHRVTHYGPMLSQYTTVVLPENKKVVFQKKNMHAYEMDQETASIQKPDIYIDNQSKG